jgi:hypothetical protein
MNTSCLRAYRAAGRISDAERVEKGLVALLDVTDDDHPIKGRLAHVSGI